MGFTFFLGNVFYLAQVGQSVLQVTGWVLGLNVVYMCFYFAGRIMHDRLSVNLVLLVQMLIMLDLAQFGLVNTGSLFFYLAL
jgi:hypothetical protein